MCTLIVSTACGQYSAALEYFNPGHVARLPFLIALSRVDLTGNSAAACMYCNRASKFGRSQALCSEGVVWLIVV